MERKERKASWDSRREKNAGKAGTVQKSERPEEDRILEGRNAVLEAYRSGREVERLFLMDARTVPSSRSAGRRPGRIRLWTT